MKEFITRYNFLEKELQNEILQVGVPKTFHAHETLIREGQFITSFPLVLKGLIRISRNNEEGNELLLYYLKEKILLKLYT